MDLQLDSFMWNSGTRSIGVRKSFFPLRCRKETSCSQLEKVRTRWTLRQKRATVLLKRVINTGVHVHCLTEGSHECTIIDSY